MVGCAGVPIAEGPPLQSSYVYSYPFDKVWDTAIDTIIQEGFIIKTLEKESGMISTESINVANVIFPNISPFAAGFTGYNTARATTTLRIKATSNKETSINIVAHIQYFDSIGKRWQYLDSKIHRNKLQAYILEGISNKLPNNEESRGFSGGEYTLTD